MMKKSNENRDRLQVERTTQLDHVIMIHIFMTIASIYITIGRFIIHELDELQITLLILILGILHFISFFKLFFSSEKYLVYRKLSLTVSTISTIFLFSFILYSFTNNVSQIELTPPILGLIAIIYSINMLKTNEASYVVIESSL